MALVLFKNLFFLTALLRVTVGQRSEPLRGYNLQIKLIALLKPRKKIEYEKLTMNLEPANRRHSLMVCACRCVSGPCFLVGEESVSKTKLGDFISGWLARWIGPADFQGQLRWYSPQRLCVK